MLLIGRFLGSEEVNNNCGKLTYRGTMYSGFIVAYTEIDSHRVYRHLMYVS